jgi:hypothetical protein
MAWSASKIFVTTLEDILENTTAIDLNTSTFNVALFDNTITPDNTVVSAQTAYAAAAGIWDTGGVFDAVSWPAVGRPLVSVTSTTAAAVWTFDAADTVSVDATTDLTNVFGCLIYDATIATPVDDQGFCYNYFGGANSVVNGTFTVVWNASGIAALTLT